MSDTSGKSILESNLSIAKFNVTPQYLDIYLTEIFMQVKRRMSYTNVYCFGYFIIEM